MNVFLPDRQTFNFQGLHLADPTPLGSGFYTTKLSIEGQPVYLQLPQCVTKDAFINTKTGKYCDLMYERQQQTDLIAFFEQVEFSCQDLIDGQKNKWFQNELTHDDIENMMASITRLYQSGKYVLVRAHIALGQKFVAYNEKEIGIDLEAVKAEHSVIPLLLIDGVKFSSKSFEIDLKLVQLMVLNDTSSSCLIKRNPVPKPNVTTPVPTETINVQTETKSVPTEETQTVPTVTTVLTEETETKTVLPEEPTNVVETVDTTTTAVVDTTATVVDETESKTILSDSDAQADDKNVVVHAPTTHDVVNNQIVEDPVKVNDANVNLLTPVLESIKEKDIKVDNTFEPIDVTLDMPLTLDDTMTLKKPNEVYYDIYKAARRKAKSLRKDAIEAYLEAKEIKTKYNLDDTDLVSSSSDDDDDEDDDDDDEEDDDDNDDEEDEEDEAAGEDDEEEDIIKAN